MAEGVMHRKGSDDAQSRKKGKKGGEQKHYKKHQTGSAPAAVTNNVNNKNKARATASIPPLNATPAKVCAFLSSLHLASA